MARINTLFVCSRNKWRSPTAERLFRDDPQLAVRARGLSAASPRRLRHEDLHWADVIFVMENHHRARISGEYRDALGNTPLHVLDIPDDYQFMDDELVEMLLSRVSWHFRNVDGGETST